MLIRSSTCGRLGVDAREIGIVVAAGAELGAGAGAAVMVFTTPDNGDFSCTLALSPGTGAASLFALVDKVRLTGEDRISVVDREGALSFVFVIVADRARLETAVHHSSISSRE